MKIIILGSGTGVPSLKRGAPGLLVQVKKQLLLFDSGAGTLNRLLKVDIDYRKLDYIFYTHFHPDHTAELVPVLFANKYHSRPRTRTLTIVGPVGLKKLYHGLLNVYGRWVKPEKYKVKIVELKNKQYKGNGWKVCAKSLLHSRHSLGYRIEDKKGKKVVYSGDTDYCDEIVELSKNTNILVLECSFPDKHKGWGHLTPRIAGKIANEAGCKHLVLTHFYPICDKHDILSQCRKVYKGKLTLAEDLICVQ